MAISRELAAPVERALRVIGRGGAGQQVLAHALSKAGDEGGVQPVCLGDQPFGGAERLDLARIGQGDVELSFTQCGDEGKA